MKNITITENGRMKVSMNVAPEFAQEMLKIAGNISGAMKTNIEQEEKKMFSSKKSGKKKEEKKDGFKPFTDDD